MKKLWTTTLAAAVSCLFCISAGQAAPSARTIVGHMTEHEDAYFNQNPPARNEAQERDADEWQYKEGRPNAQSAKGFMRPWRRVAPPREAYENRYHRPQAAQVAQTQPKPKPARVVSKPKAKTQARVKVATKPQATKTIERSARPQNIKPKVAHRTTVPSEPDEIDSIGFLKDDQEPTTRQTSSIVRVTTLAAPKEIPQPMPQTAKAMIGKLKPAARHVVANKPTQQHRAHFAHKQAPTKRRTAQQQLFIRERASMDDAGNSFEVVRKDTDIVGSMSSRDELRERVDQLVMDAITTPIDKKGRVTKDKYAFNPNPVQIGDDAEFMRGEGSSSMREIPQSLPVRIRKLQQPSRYLKAHAEELNLPTPRVKQRLRTTKKAQRIDLPHPVTASNSKSRIAKQKVHQKVANSKMHTHAKHAKRAKLRVVLPHTLPHPTVVVHSGKRQLKHVLPKPSMASATVKRAQLRTTAQQNLNYDLPRLPDVAKPMTTSAIVQGLAKERARLKQSKRNQRHARDAHLFMLHYHGHQAKYNHTYRMRVTAKQAHAIDHCVMSMLQVAQTHKETLAPRKSPYAWKDNYAYGKPMPYHRHLHHDVGSAFDAQHVSTFKPKHYASIMREPRSNRFARVQAPRPARRLVPVHPSQVHLINQDVMAFLKAKGTGKETLAPRVTRTMIAEYNHRIWMERQQRKVTARQLTVRKAAECKAQAQRQIARRTIKIHPAHERLVHQDVMQFLKVAKPSKETLAPHMSKDMVARLKSQKQQQQFLARPTRKAVHQIAKKAIKIHPAHERLVHEDVMEFLSAKGPHKESLAPHLSKHVIAQMKQREQQQQRIVAKRVQKAQRHIAKRAIKIHPERKRLIHEDVMEFLQAKAPRKETLAPHMSKEMVAHAQREAKRSKRFAQRIVRPQQHARPIVTVQSFRATTQVAAHTPKPIVRMQSFSATPLVKVIAKAPGRIVKLQTFSTTPDKVVSQKVIAHAPKPIVRVQSFSAMPDRIAQPKVIAKAPKPIVKVQTFAAGVPAQRPVQHKQIAVVKHHSFTANPVAPKFVERHPQIVVKHHSFTAINPTPKVHHAAKKQHGKVKHEYHAKAKVHKVALHFFGATKQTNKIAKHKPKTMHANNIHSKQKGEVHFF